MRELIQKLIELDIEKSDPDKLISIVKFIHIKIKELTDHECHKQLQLIALESKNINYNIINKLLDIKQTLLNEDKSNYLSQEEWRSLSKLKRTIRTIVYPDGYEFITKKQIAPTESKQFILNFAPRIVKDMIKKTLETKFNSVSQWNGELDKDELLTEFFIKLDDDSKIYITAHCFPSSDFLISDFIKIENIHIRFNRLAEWLSDKIPEHINIIQIRFVSCGAGASEEYQSIETCYAAKFVQVFYDNLKEKYPNKNFTIIVHAKTQVMRYPGGGSQEYDTQLSPFTHQRFTQFYYQEFYKFYSNFLTPFPWKGIYKNQQIGSKLMFIMNEKGLNIFDYYTGVAITTNEEIDKSAQYNNAFRIDLQNYLKSLVEIKKMDDTRSHIYSLQIGDKKILSFGYDIETKIEIVKKIAARYNWKIENKYEFLPSSEENIEFMQNLSKDEIGALSQGKLGEIIKKHALRLPSHLKEELKLTDTLSVNHYFVIAAKINYFDKIKELLNLYSNSISQISAYDALRYAILNKNFEMLNLLLDEGTELKEDKNSNPTDSSPLLLAAHNNEWKAVEHIAKKHKRKINDDNVYKDKKQYDQALWLALKFHQYDAIIALIGAGAQLPNIKTKEYTDLTLSLTQKNEWDIITLLANNLLISKNSEINTAYFNALKLAMDNGESNAITALIINLLKSNFLKSNVITNEERTWLIEMAEKNKAWDSIISLQLTQEQLEETIHNLIKQDHVTTEFFLNSEILRNYRIELQLMIIDKILDKTDNLDDIQKLQNYIPSIRRTTGVINQVSKLFKIKNTDNEINEKCDQLIEKTQNKIRQLKSPSIDGPPSI